MSKKHKDQQGYDFKRSRFVPGIHMYPPDITVMNVMKPSFDDAHDELIPWINQIYQDLGIDHRMKRTEMELAKCEEEMLEFLRDPCAAEAVDVIFVLWSWAWSQHIDLPRLMHEKLVELRSRTWEVNSGGTVHHVKKEQQHAANPE